MGTIWFFVINSGLLGIGLAADAFSVSVVNGINDPHLRKMKAVKIAGMYAGFQALMPLTGWFLTNRIMTYFRLLQKLLPWISQFFLMYLGIDMLLESRGGIEKDEVCDGLSDKELLIQAVATSVDALLIGFTIASYGFIKALVCSLIIAGVTFVLCFFGVQWGKKLGLKLAGKATLIGGLVLIFIAIEHFIKM